MSVAWISTVQESEATGVVKGYYDTFTKQRGWIPNVVKALSIRPDGLRALMQMDNAIMYSQTSGLTRAQREMIATVVSVTNRCHF